MNVNDLPCFWMFSYILYIERLSCIVLLLTHTFVGNKLFSPCSTLGKVVAYLLPKLLAKTYNGIIGPSTKLIPQPTQKPR